MVAIPIVVDGVEEVLMRRNSSAKDFVRSGFHKKITADLSRDRIGILPQRIDEIGEGEENRRRRLRGNGEQPGHIILIAYRTDRSVP